MRSLSDILVIDTDRAWQDVSRRLARRGFRVSLASPGHEALARAMAAKPDISFIGMDTDVSGQLRLMDEIREMSPRTMFIVVSCHADGFTAVESMRRGAVDTIYRPVTVNEVLASIERGRRNHDRACLGLTPSIDCVVSEHKTLKITNDLEALPYVVNQAVLNAEKVCPDVDMLKMALSEILINAVEHGNLGITMEEKANAVRKGSFEKLLQKRLKDPGLSSRYVTLEVFMDDGRLEYVVTDEGEGFDYSGNAEIDPASRIGSGLGIQIAKTFFHEVRYEGRGNRVHLVYRGERSREHQAASRRCKTGSSETAPVVARNEGPRGESAGNKPGQEGTVDVKVISRIAASFPLGLLLVTDKGRIALWNSKAAQITSVDTEGILGVRIEDAPDPVRSLVTGGNGHMSLNRGESDTRIIDKTIHTVEIERGRKFSLVLFSDVTEPIRQREDLERLLMESAETKDLMEEQAARLAITLAEMEEKNEIIRAQNQRMVGELEMAARLQKSLLPDTFENRNGVSFSCKYIPSIHIGGDLYDIVDLGGGQTGFIIADVSGHGVAAALVSAMFKMSFHALATTVASPSILMHVLNSEMRPVLDEDYITAFYVITDRFEKRISFTNAAHPTPLLYRRSTGEILELDTDGFFLGAFDEGGYEEKVMTGIDAGDALLMYTDCLLEAENPSGEQYGKERLKACLLRGLRDMRGNDVIEAIESDVRAFSGRDTFEDDFTVMLLEFWEEVSPDEILQQEDTGGGFVEF